MSLVRRAYAGRSRLERDDVEHLVRNTGSHQLATERLDQSISCHGIQAIRAARESRPVEYLKVVAVIVSKAEDLSGRADDMRDAAIEEFIEERRQQALAMIAKMDEAE
jgi:hypothetical protein